MGESLCNNYVTALTNCDSTEVQPVRASMQLEGNHRILVFREGSIYFFLLFRYTSHASRFSNSYISFYRYTISKPIVDGINEYFILCI